MPICATNPLNRLSDWPKNLPKNAPTTEFLVHSESSGGIPKVLNPSILILWIHFRVVGVKILSIGLHLTILRPNQSVIRLQMTISEEFLADQRLRIAA